MSQGLERIAGEVWLSCGYAVLLLLVAYAVDAGARALVSRASTLHHEQAVPDPDRDHPADVWPATEAERFHRGIACVVVVVGILWPASMLPTERTGPELALLAVTVLLTTAGSWPLWRHLRRTPARFPHPGPRDLTDPVGHHETAASERPGTHSVGWLEDARHPDIDSLRN